MKHDLFSAWNIFPFITSLIAWKNTSKDVQHRMSLPQKLHSNAFLLHSPNTLCKAPSPDHHMVPTSRAEETPLLDSEFTEGRDWDKGTSVSPAWRAHSINASGMNACVMD